MLRWSGEGTNPPTTHTFTNPTLSRIIPRKHSLQEISTVVTEPIGYIYILNQPNSYTDSRGPWHTVGPNDTTMNTENWWYCIITTQNILIPPAIIQKNAQ
jgi:hypothetical protein